jgi:hypothetical protein
VILKTDLFFLIVILKITETLLVFFVAPQLRYRYRPSAFSLSYFILRLFLVLRGCETKMLSIQGFAISQAGLLQAAVADRIQCRHELMHEQWEGFERKFGI